MKWLADQGVWVLRMGKIMAKKIPSLHPRIIDYAFHADKCDLLDIWLFANCTGCISSSCGIDVISKVYGRPTININAVPVRHPSYSYNLIYVPKYQRWSKKHKNFTIKEVLSADEAFVTGTFAGVIPVIQIDNIKLENSQAGKITKFLYLKYHELLNNLYPPN